MKAIRFLSAAAVAACLAFTACSDYVGKESTHPLYAKAMSAKNAKSYRESADCLEEFLSICPKSPKAHYDVALIYKENLENYPSAIYHLLKYLELSGESLPQDDQAAIRRYIQDCERLMFESYRIRNDVKLADDAPQQINAAMLSAKTAEIAALREKLQKYVENEKVILAQNQELRRRLELASVSGGSATSARQQSSASAATAASGSTGSSSASAIRTSAPSSTTGTPGTTFTDENGVRYYYVAKGEGLQAVALKMYGKSSMWKVIQEANGGISNPQYGQRLVIPPAPQQ